MLYGESPDTLEQRYGESPVSVNRPAGRKICSPRNPCNLHNPRTGGKPLPGIIGPVRNRSGRKSVGQGSGVRISEYVCD